MPLGLCLPLHNCGIYRVFYTQGLTLQAKIFLDFLYLSLFGFSSLLKILMAFCLLRLPEYWNVSLQNILYCVSSFAVR